MEVDATEDSKGPDKLRIRVTEAEKARLKAEAAAAQLSLNEYCRRKLLGKALHRGIELAQLGAIRALAQAISDQRLGADSSSVIAALEREMLQLELKMMSDDAGGADDRQAQ